MIHQIHKNDVTEICLSKDWRIHSYMTKGIESSFDYMVIGKLFAANLKNRNTIQISNNIRIKFKKGE